MDLIEDGSALKVKALREFLVGGRLLANMLLAASPFLP
jgi:hypothetical protein